MKRVCLFIYACCMIHLGASAQYAPQAGLPGSDAIAAGSSAFTGWARQCTVQRGYMNIADPSLGPVSTGDDTDAIGAPDRSIVSLGDSGVATLTFAGTLYDGPGADFAVFENGFANPADPNQSFMELAFVEVSSDGVNFFRFPANSNTQINTQTPMAGVYLDASKVNNLAGKYIAMYGTPFDLHELAGISGLDINNITHVRLIDVVGDKGAHASHDQTGRVINDPYPTPIYPGGFDLDAVGAIHLILPSAVATTQGGMAVRVFPNPATDNITIALMASSATGVTATISAITGQVITRQQLTGAVNTLPVAQYPAGMYYLQLTDANGMQWAQKIIKQ